MITLIIGLTITGIFLLVLGYRYRDDYEWNLGYTVTAITCLATVLIIGMVILGIYYCRKGEIQQFNAIKQTAQGARLNPNVSRLELAALTTEISKANQWLAEVKYFNSLWILDDLYPDEVEQLEQIK